MFTLTIETDGAAFDPEFAAPAYEVGRILHELADALTLHWPARSAVPAQHSTTETDPAHLAASIVAHLAGTDR